MVDSILNSVKQVLGLEADYTAFDMDVMIHINSTFSVLHQLGVGPESGFHIEGSDETWDAFLGGNPRLNDVKTYVYLRVRLVFDPPATSFTLSAMEKQVEELGWRINAYRESYAWTPSAGTTIPPVGILDGGEP